VPGDVDHVGRDQAPVHVAGRMARLEPLGHRGGVAQDVSLGRRPAAAEPRQRRVERAELEDRIEARAGPPGLVEAPDVRMAELLHRAGARLEGGARALVAVEGGIHPPERDLDLDLAVEHAVVDVGGTVQGAAAHLVATRDQRAHLEVGDGRGRHAPLPVEPKPPAPRSVAPSSSSSATSSTSARATGATTSCAIRSPGSMTCSPASRLTRRTITSPR